MESAEFREKLVELFREDKQSSPVDVYDYQLGDQTVPVYILSSSLSNLVGWREVSRETAAEKVRLLSQDRRWPGRLSLRPASESPVTALSPLHFISGHQRAGAFMLFVGYCPSLRR